MQIPLVYEYIFHNQNEFLYDLPFSSSKTILERRTKIHRENITSLSTMQKKTTKSVGKFLGSFSVIFVDYWSR